MQYNDTTNSTGIIQQVERYTDLGATSISGNTTLLKTITAYCNEVGKEIWSAIFGATGTWIYDDSSNVDLPQSTTNLVAAQRLYSLPTDALTIKRVEVMNDDGDFYPLTEISLEQIGIGVDEFMKTDGTPMYYRLVNHELELFPASSYSETNGLKVYFDRSSIDFVYNDTTATPGFASPFHDLISLGASIKWMKVKNPLNQSLGLFIQDFEKLKVNLIKFYQKRNKAHTPTIGRKIEHWR
jgi:hypothetical protein